MKNAAECGRKFRSLLRRIHKAPLPDHAHADDPMGVLIFSQLLWEARTPQAKEAMKRLLEATVDFNELRTLLPYETMEIIGDAYPRCEERSRRLRATLRAIYEREHAVTLDGLLEMGKRELRTWLETLDGITSFASARVMLLSFDTHAIPVDEQTRACLVEAKAVHPTADLQETASWLSHRVLSEDAGKVHGALQGWVDGEVRKAVRRKKTKTSRKKSRRSPSTPRGRTRSGTGR